MNWLQLSCREWKRRPLRSGITVMGVAIAIAALWSLLTFSRGYQAGIHSELDRLGAHVLVVPKGCPYDAASIALHGASWPCYLPSRYLSQVQEVTGVAVAAPAFMNAVYDDQAKGSDASHQFVYLGITPEMQKLKPQWKIDGEWPRQANEILVGSIVATQQGWRRGQKVLLPGLEKQQATVSGILAPTQGADDSFIHARLPDTQQWFKHPAELTHILVRLKDPNQMDTVVEQLRGCDAGLSMNVVPLTHLFHTIQTLVESTRLWLGSITLIALLVAATGVSNALLMAVTERTSEIATMRALGAGKADIFGLFWLETIQLSACGGALGVLLALLGARLTEQWLRVHLPFAPTGTLLQWQWSVAGWCVAAAVVFGSIAALLPAWRAARLEPAPGMRIKS